MFLIYNPFAAFGICAKKKYLDDDCDPNLIVSVVASLLTNRHRVAGHYNKRTTGMSNGTIPESLTHHW
ncbi:hypothetical protein OUZ56_020574 [Daphnia magna]|uniref:Uncharacterized protein n=1 Tax=Daphnia magna TaxID=35525 RepID=A0ABQ9ZEU4_9CRUS|nr:hypothetical protein OUZ56_020574 [Daphnia magna]